MNNVANINNEEISIVSFKSIPVITTEMLADFYGAEIKNIQNNFLRNTDRFIEGKHFFKLVGKELREFKKSLTLLKMVSPNARALTLWTERGAARHAKMLDTDQAWEVFEQLEDCYFHRQEILAKTHKSERTALNDAVNMLVAKTKHLNYSEAYKLVHQRFGVNNIEEIPFDVIPVAVEYVHHLIALFGQSKQMDEQTNMLVRKLVEAVIRQNFMMKDVWDALRVLNKRDFFLWSGLIVKSNEIARNLAHHLDYRGPNNEPMISYNFRHVTFSNGDTLVTNPNWFNAPA